MGVASKLLNGPDSADYRELRSVTLWGPPVCPAKRDFCVSYYYKVHKKTLYAVLLHYFNAL